MTLLIRVATLEEIPETARIYIESHRTDFPFLPEAHTQRLILDKETDECYTWLASDPLNRIFVAMQGERMAGYIAVSRNTLDPIDYEGEIAGFFVRKACRGQGLGLRLLNTALVNLQQAGFTRALVYTLDEGESKRFYQSLGGILLKQVIQFFGGEPQQVDVFGWEIADLQIILTRRLGQFGLAFRSETQFQHAKG